jgi:hypothetical protein
MRILVIGNSHAFAMRHARRDKEGVPPHDRFDCRFVIVNEPEWNPPVVEGRFIDAIAAELSRENLRLIVSTFGGNDHNVLGLVNCQPKFDFVLPEAPELPLQTDADVIPSGLIFRQLRRRLQPTLALIARLRNATDVPIVHMESPPPLPEDYILAHPRSFAEMIALRGVAPATLRYKLWRVHSAIVREACARQRIRFVASPQAMQTAEGLLVDRAFHGDPVHANEVYGEQLFRQLLAIVSRGFAAPASQ